MKQNTITTNKLAIIYFVTYVITEIILTIPDFLSLPNDFYGSLPNITPAVIALPSIIMLGIVIADMIKLHQVDWLLLIIILSTGGLGAALYPMWGKVTAHSKEIKNVLTPIVVLMLAKFIFGYLSQSYAFKHFSLRNDWAPYIGWVINIGGVMYAAKMLRWMNCKHIITWVATLVFTVFQINFGLLMLLLFIALYGSQHPGKNPINKYIILLLVGTIVARYIAPHFLDIALNQGRDMFQYFSSTINSLLFIVIIVLLVIDTIKHPIKGKVWRLLPAFSSPIYSIIAIQDIQEQNQDCVEHQ